MPIQSLSSAAHSSRPLSTDRVATGAGAVRSELSLPAGSALADPEVAKYVDGSAGTGATARANLDAFAPYAIVPRVLRGGSKFTTSVDVLGQVLPSPIMVAPTAWNGVYCEGGEKDSSEATREFGTRLVVSSYSSCDFTELGSDDLSHTWYQLLVYRDRSLMKHYIERAEAGGCSAIVLTVDAPIGCTMCQEESGTDTSIFPSFESLPLFPRDPALPFRDLGEYYAKYLQPFPSWKDVESIAQMTRLPVVVKGIMHPEDARIAAAMGIPAIIVSNHGGRQADGVVSTLEALKNLRGAAGSEMQIYLDGGIRHGSDVFKALAFGARAVLIGRPAIYGLATNGRQGLLDVLQTMHAQLRNCMMLSGCLAPGDITPDLLMHTGR